MQRLGALTKGDSRAEAGSELGAFNFESVLGREALDVMLSNIKQVEIVAASLQKRSFLPSGVEDDESLGTWRRRCHTGLAAIRLHELTKKIKVTHFLGRLLGLDCELQTTLFEYFAQCLDVLRVNAQRAGKTNASMVDIRGAVSLKSKDRLDIAGLGSAADVICLERDRGLGFQYVSDRLQAASSAVSGSFYTSYNQIYGHTAVLYAEFVSGSRTAQVWRPSTGQRLGGMDKYELEEKYMKLKAKKAPRLWDAAFKRAERECMHGPGCKRGVSCTVGRRLQQIHIITGSVIDVWSRIGSKAVKVVRCETTDGQRIVGLQLPAEQVKQILESLTQTVAVSPKLLANLLGDGRFERPTAELIMKYVGCCYGDASQHLVKQCLVNIGQQLTGPIVADLDRMCKQDDLAGFGEHLEQVSGIGPGPGPGPGCALCPCCSR